jgi:hypothetical protein
MPTTIFKRFVARNGLESGGGVAFPAVTVDESASPYSATENDFLIQCTGSTTVDIFLPQIINGGEQRQIIIVYNSGIPRVRIWDYTGVTPIHQISGVSAATLQVSPDYTTWLLVGNTPIFYQSISGAEGNTLRAFNSNAIGVYSDYSTISGGTGNTISSNDPKNSISSTISGGVSNTIDQAPWAVISGGADNRIFQSNYGFIGGGSGSTITGAISSVITGGQQNGMTGNPGFSFIGGGFGNFVNKSQYSVISGGYLNFIDSDTSGTEAYSFIGSGRGITASSTYAAMVGGRSNIIGATASYSTIVGGRNNLITGSSTSQDVSFIGGGSGNSLIGGIRYSSVVGGDSNGVRSAYSFIGGGSENAINSGANYSAIVGGAGSTIGTNSANSFIVGSGGIIPSSSTANFIVGNSNTILPGHTYASVVGNNLITKRDFYTHLESIDVNSYLAYNSDFTKLGTTAVSGEVVYFGSTTAGVGMTAGYVYEYGGTGSWGIARADSAANGSGLLGIAMGSNPSTSGVLIRGYARFTTLAFYTGLGTTGGQIYLSKTAANQFTQTAPGASGDIVRILGYCISPASDLIYFNPDTTWIELTS